MGRNKEYSTSQQGSGISSRRVDGKITYATVFDPIIPPSTTTYSVIFITSLQGGVTRLYAIPIGGGTAIEVIPDIRAESIKCDPRNRILFWSNNSNDGTYDGDNAIWAVRYTVDTGVFIDSPVKIYDKSDAYVGGIWPEFSTLRLYFVFGKAVKRGDYTFDPILPIESIELMGVPGDTGQDIWKGSTDILYLTDSGTAGADSGCNTFETVKTQDDEFAYQIDNDYYVSAAKMMFIDCDEVNDIMFLGSDINTDLEVMTLTNPVDKTVFLVKSHASWSPHSIDPLLGYLYMSHFGDEKIYRYEYGTRSPVNQTTIYDWNANGLAAHAFRMALG